jgi:NAD(P)-dependent dehydrogenase (short-subunit alcohol dehydrogenase family)
MPDVAPAEASLPGWWDTGAMADQRTALVTGANSGIGLATVLELARRGWKTVGTVRSEAKGEHVSKAAADAGVEVHTTLLDVVDPDGCARTIEEFRPDAVVNNAGYTAFGAVEDVSDDEARALLDTMVLAPIRLARLALPHLRRRKAGTIVNISSIYGRTTTPLSGWYQGAKHALEGVTDALRMEVARDGIHVVLVEPGGFRTGIWDDMTSALAARTDTRFASNYERTKALTRASQPLMGNPVRCARVIAGAVGSSRPRARYLVGYDARALALWSSLTPTEVRDRIVRLTFGL